MAWVGVKVSVGRVCGEGASLRLTPCLIIFVIFLGPQSLMIIKMPSKPRRRVQGTFSLWCRVTKMSCNR